MVLVSTSVLAVPVAVAVAIVLGLLLVTATVILGFVILLCSRCHSDRKRGIQINSMSRVCACFCLSVHVSMYSYISIYVLVCHG